MITLLVSLILVVIFIPETPKFLFSKEKYPEARIILIRMAAENGTIFPNRLPFKGEEKVING